MSVKTVGDFIKELEKFDRSIPIFVMFEEFIGEETGYQTSYDPPVALDMERSIHIIPASHHV